MATVVVFEPNKEPVLLQSVHTPDYEGMSTVVVNPDLSALVSVPKKYWKKSGYSVVEMNTAEKATVDSAEASAKEARTQAFEDLTALELAKALVALNNQSKPTTKANLVAAVKAVRNG